MSQEVFFRRIIWEGATYQKHLRIYVTCPYCGVEIMDGPLTDQFQCLHGTKTDINWYMLPLIQNEYLPHLYKVSPPLDIRN